MLNNPKHAKPTHFDKVVVDDKSYVDVEELNCMTKNLYFEAGNQKTDTAMVAVGYTVINRVKSKNYPSNVCGVVYQGHKTASGNFVKNKCQFSWVCDGKRDEPKNNYAERKAYERAKRIALEVLTNRAKNPIGNATLYHATYVTPYWAKVSKRVRKIESHIFYSNA
jgi:spore germination cell wall hydrolase CwlJ-like protein